MEESQKEIRLYSCITQAEKSPRARRSGALESLNLKLI